MDERSHQQLEYLVPAITSRSVPDEFKHYNFEKTPETLKGFAELFYMRGKDTPDLKCLVWTSRTSFIKYGQHKLRKVRAFQTNFIFSITLSKPTRGCDRFEVYSEGESKALSTLKMLFDATDDFYSKIMVRNETPTGRLPFPDHKLLKAIIRQNPTRQRFVFQNFEFGPQDCHALVTCGKATHLQLVSCIFEDDGAFFAQEFLTRLNERVGPAKLEFKATFPEEIIHIWDRYSSIELSFSYFRFDTDQCRALAIAKIRKLDILNCTFEDGGQSLVDSVRDGQGPKGLILARTRDSRQLFDTAERCLNFVRALQSNQNLESLQFKSDFGQNLACARALAESLRHSKKLTHLECFFGRGLIDREIWISLLDSITAHPALRIVRLCHTNVDPTLDLTSSIEKMTRTNDTLEEIDFHQFDFPLINNPVFRKQLIPKLQWNKLRNQVNRIRKVEDLSTRGGIVAKALARVNDKPSRIYMVLLKNIDILVLTTDQEAPTVRNQLVRNSSRTRRRDAVQLPLRVAKRLKTV